MAALLMNKLYNLGTISLITIAVLFLLNCSSKESSGYRDIEGYCLNKKWSFPIEITKSPLSTRYYSDTSFSANTPITYRNSIEKIETIYHDFDWIENLLKETLIDTLNIKQKGFVVSNPSIVIDTSIYGSVREPKFYLCFTLSVYKMNPDTVAYGLSCENCTLADSGRVMRYPNSLFLN